MIPTSSASVPRVTWVSTATWHSATLSASTGDPAPPPAVALVLRGSRDATVKEVSRCSAGMVVGGGEVEREKKLFTFTIVFERKRVYMMCLLRK